MARLYANENFAFPAVEALRQAGHEVLTSQDAGNAGRSVPDAEVLCFAMADSRALLTFNRRHFVKLHADIPGQFGIVVCSFDPNFVELAQRINAAIAEKSDFRGQLLRVNRTR